MQKIDNATRESVRALVNYLYEEEARDFESGNDGKGGHIFCDVSIVKQWLESERESVTPTARIENMDSPRSGRGVANQFLIVTSDGEYFQSYASVIAFKPNNGGAIVLDRDKWDYSTTTGKYRNQFLGEGIEETRKKIASGEYVLANLNGK